MYQDALSVFQQCRVAGDWQWAHLDDTDFDQIFFVGDIHGDPAVWDSIVQEVTQVGRKKNKESKEMEWIGGKACLVLLGDLMDSFKGDHDAFPEQVLDEARLLLDINQLALKALSKGGRIVKCMGNHERMNQQGIFHGASQMAQRDPDRIQSAFQDQGLYSLLLQSCGVYAAVKIGPFVAMHGGVSPSLLTQVRNFTKRGKRDQRQDPDIIQLSKKVLDLTFQTKEAQKPWMHKLATLLFDDADSLLWNRDFSDTQTPPCHMLKESLALLQGSMLILGHTPQSLFSIPKSQSNLSNLWHHGRVVYSDDKHIVLDGAVLDGNVPRGIRMSCPDQENQENQRHFTLFLVDVAQSRGFDTQEFRQEPDLRPRLQARRPSALRFRREAGVWRPQTVIAFKGLERKWLPEGLKDQGWI